MKFFDAPYTRVGRFFRGRPFRVPKRRVHPKAGWSDYGIYINRLIAIALIVTGITWGATGFQVLLKDKLLLWYELDADIQLALLGFVNKIMDVLLVSSLEYTASITLTTWMTADSSTGARGATFGDFDLKNELTKPWMTLWSFVLRCKRFRFSRRSMGRFVLCLCISICVLLQGLAMNTIAIPKQRWYPNKPAARNGWKLTSTTREEMTIRHPMDRLQAIEWWMHYAAGRYNAGDEGALDWAFALSASRSFDGLSDIVPVSSIKEKGWQLVHARDLGGINRWTGLRTDFDVNEPVETLSVIDKQVWSVFNWLQDSGHRFTKASSGWTGDITLMVPVLRTVCKHHAAGNGVPQGSMAVMIPDYDPSSIPNFTINFGATHDHGFEDGSCTVSFRQALHPFQMWIVDKQGADVSMNGYNSIFDRRLVYQNVTIQDYEIARALAVQSETVLSYMDRMTKKGGILQYFHLISRRLQLANPDIQSDAHGLSVVLATVLQNLISYSDHTNRSALPPELPSDPRNVVTSYPIQWHLYRSGPRLAWEWAAASILLVVLGCFLFGVWQTIWYRIAPGEWTEMQGMMVIAHRTRVLDDLQIEDKACKMLYSVDVESVGKPSELWSRINDRGR